MAHLNPTPEEVQGEVGKLREYFREKYADRIAKGDYDERDIKRLEGEDAYARCFLRTLKARGDPKKAAEVVHEAFKFRKSIGLWDLNESSFPDEILDRNAIYYKGQDNKGSPILYIKAKENTASGHEEKDMLRKFIAYNFEKHQREKPEVMCVVLMDMSGAGSGNVNMDITKYIIQCFTTNFPAYLSYMINYEMPMLLSATWKVISAFLSSEQRQKILMVKKKDIGKYLDEANLWPHMKD